MKNGNVNPYIIGDTTVQTQTFNFNIFDQQTDLGITGNKTAKAFNFFPLIEVKEDGTFDYGPGAPDP
jgi:hypothetical protein